jgi:hypothetical protein
VGDIMSAAMCMDDLPFDHWLNVTAHYGVAALILGTLFLVPPRFRRQPKPIEVADSAAPSPDSMVEAT